VSEVIGSVIAKGGGKENLKEEETVKKASGPENGGKKFRWGSLKKRGGGPEK